MDMYHDYSGGNLKQKHTFLHTNNMSTSIIVFIKLFIVNYIENPRVGGSIPSPGTTFQQISMT
jgi:hypothetical protein